MAGHNKIRAIGEDASDGGASDSDAGTEAGETAETSSSDSEATLDLDFYEMEEEPETASTHLSWIAPALAALAILAWTGFFGWSIKESLSAPAATAPSDWARMIVDWSVPVLLVCVLWLLAMRHSRVEARRFANSAALLSQESRELETRLTVVNRELSLAREFLGAQSRDLEALGRIASERISTHADSLQQLIRDNGEQVDKIGAASESALANMARLRDDLPVIANSARDVSNQVGAAGRTAQEQLDKLVAGFERLNHFGKASEQQVSVLDERVRATLDAFQGQLEAIETTAGSRLDLVKQHTADYRSEVEAAEETALEALRERMGTLDAETKAIAAQLRDAEAAALERLQESRERFKDNIAETIDTLDKLDAKAITAAQERVGRLNASALQFTDQLLARDQQFKEHVSRFQEEFATHESQASEVLAQRLADLDDALAQRREAQVSEAEKLVEQSRVMGEQLDALLQLIAKVGSQGEATRSGLSQGLDTLERELEAKRDRLRETESQLAQLTDAGVRLLEIIQASARFSREDLQEAVDAALGKLGTVEEKAQGVSKLMLGSNEKADTLSNYLVVAQAKIAETDGSIEGLQAKLAEQSDEALAKIQGLRTGFALLADETAGYAGETQDKLRVALDELEQSTRTVFETLENGALEKVDALAQTISTKAVAELERTLRNDTAEAAGKLEQAAAHASGMGREATMQLRDQLAKVNELTLNLEQRIARARELAEEQVSNDFARRMALITDSLNSNAIDLSGALSSEVADTSWDAYLKGDRGIFTRRAVRLIDSGEARDIADLYQRDETFKANVNRYIHDFEAMLRAMLSTRDGKALSVTILGSDVGKLYVVLAQAIERFRQ